MSQPIDRVERLMIAAVMFAGVWAIGSDLIVAAVRALWRLL